MNLDWIVSGVRSIVAILDRFIYSFISIVYQILINLSSTTVFSNESINEFTNRIYVLVGIIMLFKVTFSLINYLVNPDAINDKVNGAGNVAKNIIITLVLIIAVPYAFDLLYRAQYAIINDNIIPKLILGTKSDSIGDARIKISDQKYNDGNGNDVCTGSNDGYVPVANNGDYISLMTFRPFFKVSDEIIKKQSAPLDAQPYIDAFCGETTVKDILVSETYNATYGDNEFIFDYSIFFSTGCGILVALMLLSYTFDIAVRTIKLGFLEIFAPIPIISYVDPKSGKDGMFKKWLKEVWQTWLSLFVRLIVLFFAIYIIKLVNENTIQYSGNYKMWAMLFLIIGALMFAKQAPKLLEDITGIKPTLQLNPFKKINDEALGGKQILDAGARTVGVATGVVGGTMAGIKAGSEVGAVGTGAFLGALSGAATGFQNKKLSFSKGMSESYKSLTGNETKRLTPVSYILSHSKKASEQIAESKSSLTDAYAQRNEYQSRLNISEHESAVLARDLSSKGYDYNNIEAAKNTINTNISAEANVLNQLNASTNSKKQKMDSARDYYNSLKTDFDKYNRTKSDIADIDREISNINQRHAGHRINSKSVDGKRKEELEKMRSSLKASISNKDEATLRQTMETARNQANAAIEEYKDHVRKINDSQNKIGSYQNDLDNIERYAENRKNEAEIRSTLSNIDKDIDTIKKEKSQRETFYHKDPTPQRDYNSARENIEKRKNDL